jgi:hypothetical protein
MAKVDDGMTMLPSTDCALEPCDLGCYGVINAQGVALINLVRSEQF